MNEHALKNAEFSAGDVVCHVLAKLGPDAVLVDGEAFMAAEVQS